MHTEPLHWLTDKCTAVTMALGCANDMTLGCQVFADYGFFPTAQTALYFPNTNKPFGILRLWMTSIFGRLWQYWGLRYNYIVTPPSGCAFQTFKYMNVVPELYCFDVLKTLQMPVFLEIKTHELLWPGMAQCTISLLAASWYLHTILPKACPEKNAIGVAGRYPTWIRKVTHKVSIQPSRSKYPNIEGVFRIPKTHNPKPRLQN